MNIWFTTNVSFVLCVFIFVLHKGNSPSWKSLKRPPSRVERSITRMNHSITIVKNAKSAFVISVDKHVMLITPRWISSKPPKNKR